MYYLMVSVGQESRPTLAESLAQGLIGRCSRCQPGLQTSQGSAGRVSLSKLARVTFGRLRKSHFQVHSLTVGPSVGHLTAWHLASRAGQPQCTQRQDRGQRDLISEVASHFLCHIVSLATRFGPRAGCLEAGMLGAILEAAYPRSLLLLGPF